MTGTLFVLLALASAAALAAALAWLAARRRLAGLAAVRSAAGQRETAAAPVEAGWLGHAPVGAYVADADGRLLYLNAALARRLGAVPAALGGASTLLNLLAEVPPSDPAAKALIAGQAMAGRLRLKTGDGTTFDAWVAQEPAAGAGQLYGVVRPLDAEAAAGAAETAAASAADTAGEAAAETAPGDVYHRLFSAAPIGIALVDPDGKVVECNRALLALAGGGAPAPGGLMLADLVRDKDRTGLGERLAADERPAAPLEVRMTGPGETVCELHLTRLGDGGGAVAHFINATEHKNLEAQFAQSQKMQAVGQLAGGIAHDFNNLLTAMIGFSDLLLLRHRPGDQSFADIMHIKQNANRAAGLVRQLLAFSRQQTLQPRVLDVTDILAELSHLLRRLIGETIELKMVHGRDLGPVKADQGQLEQVIMNLAVNARDAMEGGGRLTIATDNVHFERPVKRKGELIPAGEYTRIRVTDSGCGIEEAEHDRIFEPFYSTKEVGAGTGLGLSTVYGIVSQTGGFVEVESEVGRGTSFSIYLPHHEAESVAEAPAGGAAVEVSRDLTGMGTVLLVEDEDAVRAFGARALRNKGYNVIEADTGETARELLLDKAQSIDLLITDVVMPRLDGPSLVREVRDSRPGMPVIFISGYAEDNFRKRLGSEAGIHFLPKPFSLKDLAGKVKEVMGDAA